MMSVLDRIVATKVAEVAALGPRRRQLEEAAAVAGPRPDFEAALRAGGSMRVIAEVKRRSPSAGEIRRADTPAAEVAMSYAQAGAAAISVLTDREYFGGTLSDLESVGAAVDVPLLRKDFTVDEVQVYESRASGASAVLLIVRILDDAQLRDYRQLAESLGMSALVEVHDEVELERAVASGAGIIGVNNRDLSTFVTDLAVTERLAPGVPAGTILVGESGIRSAADVERLAAAGAHAVLVGEALMRSGDVGGTLREMSAVARGTPAG
jgi:indole-3-glycerol phosphate synthase